MVVFQNLEVFQIHWMLQRLKIGTFRYSVQTYLADCRDIVGSYFIELGSPIGYQFKA
jgi:hypothetical protein